MPKRLFILFVTLCLCEFLQAQDNPATIDKIVNFPSSFFTKVNKKTSDLEDGLTRQTEKYLQKQARREEKLKQKLAKVDSAAAKNCFAEDPTQRYNELIQKLKSDSVRVTKALNGSYLPYLDSLKGSLSFLNNNPELLSSSKILPADVQKSLSNLQQLQGKMQQAEDIKQFLQQRKQQISNYLSHSTHLPAGIQGLCKNYSKDCYYYSEQLKEYRNILNDPDKMVKTALTLLNKVPAFTGFMQKNSMLASLFNLPTTPGNSNPTLQAVTGLQSRNQVVSVLQNQLGSTGPNVNGMVQQNVQSAQGQINTLRDKLQHLGGGGGDLDMPDFKPNNQKTKSFLKRLEYGTNIQSAQSSYFFPTTTDLGLSIGYKLNDKSTIGVGASYKIGWGKDIRHITLTQQGVGLRSFLDIKIKGSFYASGGWEYNYQPLSIADSASTATHNLLGTNWTQSGLIGLTKIVSLKSKTFKKTKLQLLWDFMSYRQRPQTPAFKFRVGYSF
ncbi:hypothetical protein A4H97_21620 [Niastella yeongjuensis]|uniref:Autotransporter domain-containing protein n=1 Tax=Niastella yeongjuensis TaxID=354355 RepID=A0A1V9F8H2_9BACT|nr:hypothetical protein [Niastella yeongjuensis]OQP54571.1 hypothetical protein A4H97_21620 [Niastella yeongjuensis]SEN99297.1 hypothetical protein SAMN05660816_01837 [Niastella yeongjuensis]